MGCADIYLIRTARLQGGHGCHDRARSVDHVVVQDADLAFDIADQRGDNRLVVLGAALMHDSQVGAHNVGELLRRLRTAQVGADDAQLLGVEILGLEVFRHDIQGGQMIDGNVEEALDLALMQVDGDDSAYAGDGHQIGNQLRGDGLARSGLAVLAGIAVMGDDRGDGAGGCALRGICHDEQLHEGIVDMLAGHGLDQEDVCAAHAFQITRIDFTIGELLQTDLAQGNAQAVRNLLRQLGIAGAGKDGQGLLHFVADHVSPNIEVLSLLGIL